MPANPKYLTPSLMQRLARLLLGFIGGFVISTLIHLLIAGYTSKSIVLITSTFSCFILWAILFIAAYIPKKIGFVTFIYFSVTLLLGVLLYLSNFNTEALS